MKSLVLTLSFLFVSHQAFAINGGNMNCKREILASALSHSIQSVPNSEALLNHSFSIAKAGISEDDSQRSLVTVEAKSFEDGSIISLDYSIGIVNAANCQVRVNLIAD